VVLSRELGFCPSPRDAAMGKRGAAAAAASPRAKAAKAKGKAPAVTEVDAAPDPLAPVIAFLDEIDLLETCRKMLQAAAPYALKTPKEQQHEYQASIVKELTELYAQAEQRHVADLAGAKAAATEHADASAAARVALEATTERVANLLKEKEAKNVAYETAADGIKKAKAALQAEQEKVASIAGDKAEAEAKRSEFDQVMQGDFVKLKNSEFPNKEWRARNKTIARVLEHFGHAEVSQSLLDALPVALKTIAADRGKFALVVVEHADAAVNDQMEKMTAAIGALDAAAAEQTRAVAGAEQAIAAAEEVGKVAWQEMVDAENAWVEEQGKKDAETATVKSAAPKAQELVEQVEKACRAMERFNGLRAHFDALVEPAAPQPEVADASPAPEAPAEAAAPEVGAAA